MYHYDPEKERVDAELDKINNKRIRLREMRKNLTYSLRNYRLDNAEAFGEPPRIQEIDDQLKELDVLEKTTRAQWYSFRKDDEAHNASLNAYLAEERARNFANIISTRLGDLTKCIVTYR